MDKIQVAKFAVNVVVGAGVKRIVKAIIENNVQPENFAQTLDVAVGSYVLAAMAAGASKNYTDAKIDKFVEWWQKEDKTTDQPVIVEG